MLQYDFQSSIGYWICMTSRAYERAMQQELEPTGITHRQCQVLCWLALDGPLSQVELADRMSIEPPTKDRRTWRRFKGYRFMNILCPFSARGGP